MKKQFFAIAGSLFFLLVGCGPQPQQSNHELPVRTTPQAPSPAIRAIPAVQREVKAQLPHYKFENNGDYVYETLDDTKQLVTVRYLGSMDGQHRAVIHPERNQYSMLSCKVDCSAVTATNYYGLQRIGTEVFIGPGSLESVIMRDAAAKLLKTGVYQPKDSSQ